MKNSYVEIGWKKDLYKKQQRKKMWKVYTNPFYFLRFELQPIT